MMDFKTVEECQEFMNRIEAESHDEHRRKAFLNIFAE